MSYSCILLLFYLSYTFAFCIHDEFVLKHNKTLLYTVSKQVYANTTHKASLIDGVQEDSFPTQYNTKPLRFKFYTDYLDYDYGYSCYAAGDIVNYNGDNYTCTDDDVLTPDREEYVRRILLPAAQAQLVAAFLVMPVQGPLFLAPGRCGFQGGVAVPDEYTHTGVGMFDTDLVVFVTSRPIKTDHVLAFAGQCQEDQIGRSIAGHLNLNPTEVDLSPEAHAGQLGIVLHELTHVLGFSIGKFSSFHVPAVRSSMAYSYITSHAMAHDQTESVAVINTPKVLQLTRQHFACDNLEGGWLEDGGGAGTKLSHWEKRMFMNEYMTGEATHNPVFSYFTLALFEDSGWYMVNYDAAAQLVWGYGQGCDFIQKACSNWPKTNGYFCEDDSATACTFDMQAKGTCNLDSFDDDLPLGNQYFGNSKKGGADSLADYCPYSRGDTFCIDESNGDIPSLIDSGETYCKNCRCFSTSLVKEFPFGGSRRLGCYQMECAGLNDMRVKVGKLWYTCTANATVSVEGYGGHIYCPSDNQVQAVCKAGPYALWPTVTSINPAYGGPGTLVTITGAGFSGNITSVVIHEECLNVTVISSTQIIATIPGWRKLGNPAHIVAERVSVVVMDKEGRTGMAPGLFSLRVNEDPIFYIYVVVWMIDNWLAFLAVGGAIGAVFFVKAARKRDLERQLHRSVTIVQSE